MSASPPAHVPPEVLRWARESMGFGLEEASRRIHVSAEKLESAERGEARLTLRQAEKAAETYNRPLAALFVEKPPEEEPQEALFRRLPGAPEPPWPPEMRLLADRVREKQDAAAEIYALHDESSPWREVTPRLRASPRNALHSTVRELLGVGVEVQSSWRDPTGYTALRQWVDAIEALGPLVMQDGTLPLELMRGFASTHPDVPAVVVNTQDDARARAFTAIHELGHLCLEARAEPASFDTEEWCNQFAGQVLMPGESVARTFERSPADDPLEVVDEVALTFGVTPHAAAVRLQRVGLLAPQHVGYVLTRIRSRGRPSAARGGDYYRTKLTRLGPSFTRLVLSAVDDRSLSYPAASTLLETKVNHSIAFANICSSARSPLSVARLRYERLRQWLARSLSPTDVLGRVALS